MLHHENVPGQRLEADWLAAELSVRGGLVNSLDRLEPVCMSFFGDSVNITYKPKDDE